MMRRPLRLLAATAASLALVSTPVMARDHWGRGGHGWGRHHDRDNGVDAGDIIAGVAVIGAIAAIAGVFDGDRNEPSPEPARYPDPPRRAYDGAGSNGMDRAVDMCVGEVERTGGVVTSIDSASRTGEGWFVSGGLDGGAPFTCRIGNDGRVEDVEIGDGGQPTYYGAEVEDKQYDDATYARARDLAYGVR